MRFWKLILGWFTAYLANVSVTKPVNHPNWDLNLKTYMSGTERWNNGKNMLFINFQMEKGNFLWILTLENTDSDTKRSEMITGHGSIVSTNDKKSKSRFGFDMTIPYYSNLIKAVQSTTTYDNDNIRKDIWNISFQCTRFNLRCYFLAPPLSEVLRISSKEKLLSLPFNRCHLKYLASNILFYCRVKTRIV